jgi:hypothetical protein
MLSIDTTNVIKVVASLEEGLEDEFEVCFERDDFFLIHGKLLRTVL